MKQSIKNFISRRESGVQLDIFRENGQVLIQVFKYSDVTKWENKIDFGNENGFVVHINFSKGKLDNSKNFKRFKDSDLNEVYQQVLEFGRRAYFAFVKDDNSAENLENIILMTLNTLYGDVNNVTIEVNRYIN